MSVGTRVIDSPLGRSLTKAVGLPPAAPLRRQQSGEPPLDGPVLLRVSAGGRLGQAVTTAFDGTGVPVSSADDGESEYAALVYDATGMVDVDGLRPLYEFLHGALKRLRPSGRVLVLGVPPEDCSDPSSAAAHRALDGFVRSVGKEVRRGATANLVYVEVGAELEIESTVRFFLSGRSAYVSGQNVRVRRAQAVRTDPEDRPLDGRVALVTGAARGLGAAIAAKLATDGARVVCLDVPGQGEQLTRTANDVRGIAYQLDVTAADAPPRLSRYLADRFGGLDILVHNAGITRDKLLVNMDESQWDSVIAVNLKAQLRINDELIYDEVLRPSARVVCVSSQSGIAGNRGQTNYSASKAGVIGLVRATASRLTHSGGTVNAIAPGFIETEMSAQMPFAVREMGRRINSLGQGGQPVDVAETVAWLVRPSSGGVNGQVVRVCGQNMLGA